MTNLPQSVSRLSNSVGSLTSHNPMGITACYGNKFTLLLHFALIDLESGHDCFGKKAAINFLRYVKVFCVQNH
jgi:hypothetical protein